MFLCFSEENQWEIHLIHWEIQLMGNSARATNICSSSRRVVYDNREHVCNEIIVYAQQTLGFTANPVSAEHIADTPVVSGPAFNLPSLLDTLCCFVCVHSHVVLNLHI